jgi:hypothetical protein
MKRETLVPLTVKELRTLATQKGIPKASSLVKSELIEALASSSKNSAPTAKSAAPTKAPTKAPTNQSPSSLKNNTAEKKIVTTKISAGKVRSSVKVKSKKNAPVSKSTRTRKRISLTSPKRKNVSQTAVSPKPLTPTISKFISTSSLRVGAPPTPHNPQAHGANPGLPIPDHYGRDRLVLMVQDPLHIFAYWELQAETVARAINDTHGGDPVLVIHTSGNTETRSVDLRGGNYYLSVSADQDYEAELALRSTNGALHVLVRSNKVHTPAPTISQRVDEQWMGIENTEGSFHELLELAGLPGQVAGANSVSRLRDQRLATWNWQHSGVTSISSAVLSSHNRSSSARLSP